MVIFFILFSIMLSQPHDLGHMFSKLTRIDFFILFNCFIKIYHLALC